MKKILFIFTGLEKSGKGSDGVSSNDIHRSKNSGKGTDDKSFIVRDGILSVADYNSTRVGVVVVRIFHDGKT